MRDTDPSRDYRGPSEMEIREYSAKWLGAIDRAIGDAMERWPFECEPEELIQAHDLIASLRERLGNVKEMEAA